MAFHFLNTKQHFASIHWEPIASERGYKILKDSVQENWDALSAKEQAAWTEVFTAFEQLPLKEAGSWREKELCRVAVGIGTFATKSPHNDTFPDDYQLWGWEQAGKLQAHTRLISQWVEKNKLWVNPIDSIKKVVKWKQRLDQGEYELKVFDPVEVLAEAESYAIYIPSAHSGGYLDGRGFGGAPLAGARMFETAGSAYTTINSRGLSNAVVVKVKSNLLALDSKSTSTNCGDILSAVSLMEKKRLEEALEEASVEQLLARLARLEANNTSSQEVEEEAPKKRRM